MDFQQFHQAMLAAIDRAQNSDQIVTVSFDPNNDQNQDGDEDGTVNRPSDADLPCSAHDSPPTLPYKPLETSNHVPLPSL